MNGKQKFVITTAAGMLLFLLYCAIFLFSEQDGETSGSISMTLSKLGVEFWEKLTGGHLTAVFKEQLAVYFEHPLRKAAHFTEYAVMGVLTYLILSCHVEKRGIRFLWAVVWVLLSAAADEFHQYFVPGRWASPADVLLDTCGGAFGAFFCMGIVGKVRMFRD